MSRGRAIRASAIAVSVATTVVFGYLAIRDVKWHHTWSSLTNSNYWWVVPATAAMAVSVLLRAVRWQSLYRHERRPGLAPISKAMLVGLLFNIILPVRAGELVRIVALKSYAGTSRAETTATIVVERLVDVVSLLALLFVCVPWLPHVTWLRAAAIVALLALVGLGALLVIVAHLARGPAPRLVAALARLPLLDQNIVRRLTASVVDGLASLRRPRQALVVVVWTTLSWLVLGLAFWFLTIGFHLHLSLLAGLLVAIAIGLSFIVPAAPGGVGVFEAAGLAATSAYGIPKSQALGYVLVLHVLNVVPFLLAGAAVLALGGRVERDRLARSPSAAGALRGDVEARNS